MAESDFGFSSIFNQVPQLNLGSLLPASPFKPVTRQPLIINAPRAEQALVNKYSTYMRELGPQYDRTIIQSMMDYDAQRVKNGQSPLGEAETRAALEAARTQGQPTPEPKRSISSPFDWLGNAIGDIDQIVRSIPRIPSALFHEAKNLNQIPQAIADAPNPVAGLFAAPGIRMLPGAFVAESIAAGTPGELLRHPVFTALDVLPLAHSAAKATPMVRAVDSTIDAAARANDLGQLNVRQFRQLEQMHTRPVSTALLNRANPTTGLPIDQFGNPLRNAGGQLVDAIKESPVLKMLRSKMGRDARDATYGVGDIKARVEGVFEQRRQPGSMEEFIDPELDRLALRSHQIEAQFRAIDPELMDNPAVAAKIVDALEMGDYRFLNTNELAAVELTRQLNTDWARWSTRNNFHLSVQGEIYDVATGTQFLEKQRAFDERATLHEVQQAIAAGDHTLPMDILAERLGAPAKTARGTRGKAPAIVRARSIQRGELGARELTLTWRSTQQALRNAGFDTSGLDRLVGKGGPGIRSTEFIQAIDDLRNGKAILPSAPSMTPDQFLAYADANRAASIGYRDLIHSYRRGDWKGVTEALDIIKSTDQAFVNGVKNARDTAKLLSHNKMRAATATSLAKAEAELARFKLRNQPARFLPMKQQLVRGLVADDLIRQHALLPISEQWSVERILAARDAGELVAVPGFTTELYDSARLEAARTIEDMRAKGFDPVFVHTVPGNRVESSLRLPESIVPNTPGVVKKRMDDLTPGIKNLAISFNDIGMTHIAQSMKEMQVKWVADTFGHSLDDVNSITHESAAYRAGKSPAFSYEGHKAKVINERFKALDPEELGMSWGSPYVSQLNDTKVFVPIEVYAALKDMTNVGKGLSSVFDPITKTFRIATTALSLRTQIYNVVGGSVALLITDPSALFRYWGEARAMLKDPALIPADMRVIVGSSKRGLLELDDITKGKVTEGVRKFMVGEKLRKMWDQAQAAKTPGKPITGRFGDKIKGLVEKSYDLNSLVDDQYRMMSYLSEYNRQLANGISPEVASYRAVGAARKVLQDYMAMTPFERNVIKSVIPFYGFIGHAIRFVMRFPFDHPLRTEFMTKLAMAELEDNNMGLPSRFMAMLFFGDQDDKGNQHALNLGPFNPFGDVANSMTLAGFIGNTNPVLQTIFEQVGLQRGQSELYPSLRYDPETGRMEAATPGFAETVIGNVIPQAAGVMALIGMNQEYNDMRQRDLDAAGRYLLSTMTVPTLERTYNIPQEQFAAELARQRSAKSVLNEALKSGDWSEAMLYPSLAAYLAALDAMPAEQKEAFQPTTREDNFLLAQQAFSGQVLPTSNRAATTLNDLVAAQMALGGPIPGVPTVYPQPVSGLASGGALGLNGI